MYTVRLIITSYSSILSIHCFLYNIFYICVINQIYYKLIIIYNKTIHSYVSVKFDVYSNILEIINFKIIRLS